MVRGIVVFVLVMLLLHGWLLLWKASTWQERLRAFKVILKNLVIALLTLAIIAGIVILF